MRLPAVTLACLTPTQLFISEVRGTENVLTFVLLTGFLFLLIGKEIKNTPLNNNHSYVFYSMFPYIFLMTILCTTNTCAVIHHGFYTM